MSRGFMRKKRAGAHLCTGPPLCLSDADNPLIHTAHVRRGGRGGGRLRLVGLPVGHVRRGPLEYEMLARNKSALRRGFPAENARTPHQRRRGRQTTSGPSADQYIPPMSGAAGAGAGGSGLSATRDSVVSTIELTEAAFSRALRVTLAGSMMPEDTMSQ